MRKVNKITFVFTDFIAAFLAWVLFFILRKIILEEGVIHLPWSLLSNAAIIASFWTLLYALTGQYREVFRKSRVKEILNLAQISFVGGVIIFFVLLLDDEGVYNYQAYYKTIATYLFVHFFTSALCKTLAITHNQNLVKQGKVYFNTLIIGSNSNARDVYKELEKNNRHLGLQIKGFVHVFDSFGHFYEDELCNLGPYRAIADLIKLHQIEEVIIAIEPQEHEKITEILSLLEGENVRISILPDVYQILLGSVKVNHLFGTPLIEVKQDLMPVWQEILKRAADIAVSLFFMLFFCWVYFIIALLVKLSSPGNIIYRQERIGKSGRPFYIYKFRSMFADAETNGPALSSDLDPRVTPWGRFMRKVRLDELPQFYNVLVGEMSLVGPRPERQYFIDQIVLAAPQYKHLLRVRPGITSLGLVKFGYAQNVEEMVKRLKYDILYIENMSLAMDFRVLLYTIKVIVEGRGK
ncbi:UDP-glucose:undecaprenyl-phosphate glucose-1-phosphate transferase [Adhaeribacter pallidiroseus]|uniref:UDP-glucose:undecaprenyl-phosphate glucose-1-phosphate transferase n=1 Tax=Adhaeribacter pallidiroseus TaxID=2072847 RepID=A0A369QE40_9BACT|nr:UDP-glucose:undecaprenyl-phosphate glucose-1-phosphate transferase [Adhaeribacter pallidiroseus]